MNNGLNQGSVILMREGTRNKTTNWNGLMICMLLKTNLIISLIEKNFSSDCGILMHDTLLLW